MRNWSATSNLLSLLCHFLPSTRHFSHVLIEAYRPGTFTAWVMDGNFSGYWIAILVFISSFPRTDRLLASVQMSFLSYRYPTSPAPSYKSGIDYCCSFWVSILFRWTEMYSKLHFSLAPSSCKSRFKKAKVLPRRAANINTPSSLWHKRQKQTLICAFPSLHT